MFRRILVGFDGSEFSAHALRVALKLAEATRSEVVTMSVVAALPHLETEEDRQRELEAARINLTRDLDKHRAMAADRGVTLTTVTLEGSDPVKALVSHINTHGFDLLVVGRRGRDYPRHVRTGRSLDKVLLEQPCPILVV